MILIPRRILCGFTWLARPDSGLLAKNKIFIKISGKKLKCSQSVTSGFEMVIQFFVLYFWFGWTGYFRFENVLNFIFLFFSLLWFSYLRKSDEIRYFRFENGWSGFNMILLGLWSPYFDYLILIINFNMLRDLNSITSGLKMVLSLSKCNFRFQKVTSGFKISKLLVTFSLEYLKRSLNDILYH